MPTNGVSRDHFLVVEERARAPSTLTAMLEPWGRVTRVHHATDAIEVIHVMGVGEEWTGLFTELNLPDGNGLDVVAYLAARGVRIPSLIGTMSSPATFADVAGDLDAEFVRLPFDIAAVTAFVERARAARERRRALPVKILVAWQRRYNLTPGEEFLLRCSAMDGAARRRITEEHAVRDPVVRRNLGSLLRKTMDASLEDAIRRMLGEDSLR